MPCEILHIGFSKIANDYKSDLIRLGYENFVQQVATYKSMSGSLEGLYYELLKRKEITPLESLPDVEKMELWSEVLRLDKTKNKKDRILLARALHGFGTYLNL